MSCWATVAIAAEYLRTSVQDVLGRVIAGELYSREENGELFVAVPGGVTGGGAEDDGVALNFRGGRAGVRRVRPGA